MVDTPSTTLLRSGKSAGQTVADEDDTEKNEDEKGDANYNCNHNLISASFLLSTGERGLSYGSSPGPAVRMPAIEDYLLDDRLITVCDALAHEGCYG